MTVKDALNAVKVMLGQDTPKVEEVALEETVVEETVETNLAKSELVDGTVVYSEGDLEVGATLFVETEGEEDVFAPAGKHSTKDGSIITVGESGVIEAIDSEEAEPAQEEVIEEEVVEEELSDVSEETPTEEVFNAEDFVQQIAELIKPYQTEINELKSNLEVLTERFEAVADLPSAKPLRKSFMEEAKAAKMAEDARIKMLARIKRGK